MSGVTGAARDLIQKFGHEDTGGHAPASRALGFTPDASPLLIYNVFPPMAGWNSVKEAEREVRSTGI